MRVAAMALAAVLLGPGAARSAERWAILAAGISGDAEMQEELFGWTRTLKGLLTGRFGFAPERVSVLVDDPARDPGLGGVRSTRENLQKACADVAGRAGREDRVFVFLAGHGSYDGQTYKLNLPGPDPSAEEIAAMIDPIPAGRVVVVNATTASGGSVAALAGGGRVVVAATRSGQERNRTHFGKYFVAAFEAGAADADKSGRVSLLEAFLHAAREVEAHYAKEGNLATEHAVLEDDGDGKGHPKPGPDNGDGVLARTTYLDPGPARAPGGVAAADAALAHEAERLEAEIEALKYAKARLPEAEYAERLEALLLRLARVNARRREGK